MMHRGQPTMHVGAGADTVGRHGAVPAGLELFFAQGLQLDRVFPVEGFCDLD